MRLNFNYGKTDNEKHAKNIVEPEYEEKPSHNELYK